MAGGKSIKVFIYGCVLLLFGVVMAHMSENATDAPPLQQAATAPSQDAQVPPPAPVETAYDPEIVAVGERIFSQAKAKYSSESAYIDVWGSGYPDAEAALFVPEIVWDSLSEEKRNAMAVFIQSEIPNIRRDPDKYIGFAKGVALYKRLHSNISNIADGRYVIMTTIERNGHWIKDRTVAEGK